MQKVAIVGVGLIGASFGLALRKAGFTGPIIGVSSPGALEAGLKVGAISETAPLPEAAITADLIYLAQPVDRIIATIEEIGAIASGNALITDAGSTKVEIVRAAAKYVKPAEFLGGHPMAGKESSGAAAADADLFQGRVYVLQASASEKAQEFREWLTRLGATVVEMTPEHHDATVALSSHLPQLLSTALAAFLASQDDDTEIFGAGLLDMTRLALSSPELWSSIVGTNANNVRQSIDAYIDMLIRVRESIGTPEFRRIFATSATFAASLRKLSRSRITEM